MSRWITPAQALRLFRINFTLIRYGLDEIIYAIPVFKPMRSMARLAPWRWFGGPSAPLAVRLRLALEELGPVFVKFGQMLSTRVDLLPPDIAAELAKLQDRVPPFAGEAARALVEKALDAPVEEAFRRFDSVPLASASVAQVHAATLHSGEEVVVKVLRPDIKKTIRRDVGLLYIVARIAQTWWSGGRRLRPVEVVAEYDKTLAGELDLMREAANAGQLGRNFAGSPVLHVPQIHWPYCRRNVMVMERVYGVPIGDIERLRAAGVDLRKLAETGVEIFFTQVFEHNFFHADMHPGNLFVCVDDPANPRYMGVDFGIMGALERRDQMYLAENFLAFFNCDYRRVARLHIESGWVPENTRESELEAAVRTVCEPLFQRPLHEISFGQLLLRLFQIGREFDMEVQPQLALLQKTFLNIEGLGRQLYPELDLWKTGKPFFEKWSRRRARPAALLRALREHAPRALERAPRLPEMAWRALRAADAAETRAARRDRLLRAELRAAARKVALAVIAGAVLIALAVYFF